MAPRRAASHTSPTLTAARDLLSKRDKRESAVTDRVFVGIGLAGCIALGSLLFFWIGSLLSLWIIIVLLIGLLSELVARLSDPFWRLDTTTGTVLIGTIVVGTVIKIVGIDVLTDSVEGKVAKILGIVCLLGILARELTILFRSTSSVVEKVLLGITFLATVICTLAIIRHLTGPVAGPEGCLHVHRAASGQAGAPTLFGVHRSLEHDTAITECPSAAKGDYGPCLRNSLNHSQSEGRVTYDTTDTMRFFWELRPRLLEPRPRLPISKLRASDKPSFNVSRLSPTQREGLILWSKCTYPPFGQTLTQPLNLSCPFQAFNLLFFHNTLGDGQMFLPTESIKLDPPPRHIDVDLQDALLVSIPNEDVVNRYFPPRILHIGATPSLKMTSLDIELTPYNLAKTLSRLLHEMLHVAQYIYTCPICYSRQCAPLGYPDFGRLRYAQMWLPLTVAIDLMLAKEGILEIPGVNWKEYRLDLHADRVAAAMKNKVVALHEQAELNGEEWGEGFLRKMRASGRVSEYRA